MDHVKTLVLQCDGLHLGYLGCYGNDWVCTPALDRLATDGTVFDLHFADCFDAWPSYWNGLYTFPWRSSESASQRQPEQLQAIFHQHGIPFVEVHPKAGDSIFDAVNAAAAALDSLQDRTSWLVWAKLPHLGPPWSIPDEFLEAYFPDDEPELTPILDPPVELADDDDLLWSRLQLTYAALITYVDDCIAALLGHVDELFSQDNVLVIITAARGLSLGEHGIIGSAPATVHEEQAHLPLIIRFPGKAYQSYRVFSLTQSVDLFPTLLECFALPAAPCHGHSLLPLLGDENHHLREYACAGVRLADAEEWLLRSMDWSLIVQRDRQEESPRWELFAKPHDRWEVNDLHQHHIEMVEAMERTLERFIESTDKPGPMQPEPLPMENA